MKAKYIKPSVESVITFSHALLVDSGPGSGKPAPDGPSKGRSGDVEIDVLEEGNETAYALWAMEHEEDF